MKLIRFITFGLAWGQTLGFGAESSRPAASISERGDHYRVWQRVTVERDEEGRPYSLTNSAYTELETGMHVKQPDGTWAEASDEIEIIHSGGIARKTRHRVHFAPNCNSPVAIDLLSADGRRLRSRILGLGFFDRSSRKSVLIAEIKDSEGRLLMENRNEVVYYDAFTDLKADVRYRNSKAGLEQDIILRENPPSPAEYELNPATTVLEVLTEFISPPVPKKRVRMVSGDADEFLDFGDLKMGNGRVFLLGKTGGEIPVTKQWGNLDRRTFLIEQIPYKSIEPELKSLPRKTAARRISPDGVLHRVSARRLLPEVQPTKQVSGSLLLASAPLSGPGVVLDYIIASSDENYTFRGDTTHYVNGPVHLSGTNTTIEGGAVIKFARSASARIDITGRINCQTGAYRPAVFTGEDDNTVGETIAGSTGSPTNHYGNGLTVITPGNALHDLRFLYAGSAVNLGFTAGLIQLANVQFVRCQHPLDSSGQDANTIAIENSLFYSSVHVVHGGQSLTVRGLQLTANHCSSLVDPEFFAGAGQLYLTNSLIVAATNGWGQSDEMLGSVTTDSTVLITNCPAGVFQTVGAASHYLADQTYRNAGTTNIPAALVEALKSRTTCPPLLLTTNFTANTILAPQALRDADLPDLGYHYDPLDYVMSGRTVSANLTLTNGVAVGTYGPSSSFGLGMISGKLVSEGGPTQLNWIARYNVVQEQSTTNWSAGSVAPSVKLGALTRFEFTAWSLLGNNGNHVYALKPGSGSFGFRNCQFGGGGFYFYGDRDGGLTNCLWERVRFNLGNWKNQPNHDLYNNLFRGGSVQVANYDGGISTIRDNLFDETSIDQGGTLVHSHNAYVMGSSRLTPPNSSDVVLSGAPTYQTSFLGNHYYPTNGASMNLLLNAGSRKAGDAGLFHYTTMSNQAKETNSTVDIGFHYVATDGLTSRPVDTDGDGLPDYLEDRNGNGSYNSGDIANWNAADTDSDGVEDGTELIQGRRPTVGGLLDSGNLTKLKVFTPLR